jgi:hypothetical protein
MQPRLVKVAVIGNLMACCRYGTQGRVIFSAFCIGTDDKESDLLIKLLQLPEYAWNDLVQVAWEGAP